MNRQPTQRNDFSRGLNMGCGVVVAVFVSLALLCVVGMALMPSSFLNRGFRTATNDDEPDTGEPESHLPSRDDFAIDYDAVEREFGLYFVGTVTNNGKLPAYIEIEISAKDKDKRIVQSITMYPNSTTNIMPGETVAVDRRITDNPDAEFLGVRIVRVDQW